MKSIHYAGDTLLTGDAIADSLVHYAEALARKETSAAVDIPVRMADGAIAQATFLLGPASQLVAIPERSELPEIIDDGLVRHLERESALLGDAKPQSNDSTSSYFDFDELDLS